MEIEGNFGEHYVIKYQPRNTEFSSTCKLCEFQSFEGNASHCFACGTCVLVKDHHCGVFGKCIGEFNLKKFRVV